MRKISSASPEGMALRELLQKAAGLEGQPLRSLECRVAVNEAVIFKAEIMGTAEHINAALAPKTPEEMVEILEKAADEN